MSEETTSTATETTAAETTAAETETTLVTGAAETTEASTEGSDTEAATTTEAAEETAETKEAVEYTDFTAPEGVELDAELTDEFKALAKEAGLPQDKAQKAVDIAVKLQQKAISAGNELFEKNDGIITHPEYREKWIGRVKADPEVGGDKLDATLATAKRGIDAYCTPAFAKFLDSTGLGNHPEMVRAWAKVGATVGEDSKVVTNGNPNATGHQTLAGRLFSSSKE